MKTNMKVGYGLFLILTCCSFYGISQQLPNAYQDKSHFSKTFEAERSYRIYLPEDYESDSKQYPVIYFFHGYGGRHYQDYNALLEYEMIGRLVNKYQVMLVMWDGRIIESLHRPYNIGCPDHVSFDVQMKDYFPELVAHIDASYNTLSDREHRGIIGYSMGGFMSFFIAGKYPDMIGAAVNMTGSPEFHVGYPDNNTLYSLRHTFENLKDVKTRLHNSSVGELSSQNREVHKGALWQGNMDYEYWEFSGGHKVDNKGETDVFEMAMNFVDRAFRNPKPLDKQWSHYDLYSDFEIWDYSVKSNKKSSGLTYLRNVSKDGFGFYTKKWLPIAPPLDGFNASIVTAPIYEPKVEYQIRHYEHESGQLKLMTKKADSDGRLSFELDGQGHEIGISKKEQPRLVFVNHELENGKKMIRVGEENKMVIQLVNLGGMLDGAKKVSFKLKATDGSVSTDKEEYEIFQSVDSMFLYSEEVILSCKKQAPTDGEPSEVKIILSISYDTLMFKEEFDVPVFFAVPQFEEISIDDGRLVKDAVFGTGNGDGIISPGEQVMIYTSGHRTKLFYDDPYIEILKENQHAESLAAKWSCDGITVSSIVKIAEDCPDNYEIKLLAKYETKDYMPITRRCFWGSVNIKVKSVK
ncbi:alpha/beta hydrolase-fold protein [Reichenbachiella sp. MALMAid0571]|uniref:alpha/beta hydrolase n=1 Tax=Reichenbachiella sp. MALMAid0571 TaxID=3143939 RepID=UPI0032DEE03B